MRDLADIYGSPMAAHGGARVPLSGAPSKDTLTNTHAGDPTHTEHDGKHARGPSRGHFSLHHGLAVCVSVLKLLTLTPLRSVLLTKVQLQKQRVRTSARARTRTCTEDWTLYIQHRAKNPLRLIFPVENRLE